MSKININPNKELMEKFMNWMFEKQLLYGSPFDKWWEERGMLDFLKFAKEKFDTEYVKENL